MKIETIVITGGIGSGKSRVLEAIKKQSEVKVDFFNFDDYTKELYELPSVRKFLMTMFGTTDRKKISDMVFAGSRQIGKTQTVDILRDQLNDFFFHLVEDKFVELVNRKQHRTLIIEMPMYFEMEERSTEMQLVRSKIKVITVGCDEDIQIDRVKNRDGFTEEKIHSIIASQKDRFYKVEHADYVIDTTNNDTEEQVTSLMRSKFKKIFFPC